MQHDSISGRHRHQQGFTLIEAMIAMVILIFGLAAVANLMVVAGTSNTVANHSTAAALVASQQMEALKAQRYDTLVTGGSIVADAGVTGQCGVTLVTTTYNCTTRSSGANAEFLGVGTMHVRWQIFPAVAVGSTTTRFIQVAAESMAPAVGRRSRVVLTTFRTDNQ
jgi:prepilin-type N-terminal cleavage/methylation domain-containing protein